MKLPSRIFPAFTLTVLLFCGAGRAHEGDLAWSTFLGGSGHDMGFAIALDGTGDVYVTGRTGSPNFPVTAGAYDETFNGALDVFVARLDASGTSLVCATVLGGSKYDAGWGIAVDSSGNVYVAGDTESDDFPVTAGAFDTNFGPPNDAFVLKLSPTGSDLLYATYLGGSFLDWTRGLTVDLVGHVYLSGETMSWDFPTTPGAYDRTYNDRIYYTGDAFVAKLTPTGDALAYATFLGGSDYDYGYGIAIDSSGEALVVGMSYSADFPATDGAYDATHNGSGDVFVARIDATGSNLNYATYLGGNSRDYGKGIVVDGSGNIYLSGYTESYDFPTTEGAWSEYYRGGYDAFVVKLDPTGSTLGYSTYLGGSGNDNGYGIAVDGSGYACLIGWTTSSDYPTTAGALDRSYNGGSDDVFVTQLDPTGGELVYSTFLGGEGRDGGYGIALDGSGKACLVGQTYSYGFPVTSGAYDETFNGGWEVYVAKLSLDPAVVVSETPAAELPQTYALHQNFPNPFNPNTEIRYRLAEVNHVTLKIFNDLGQEVRSFIRESQEAGEHAVTWDGRDDQGREVASGVYFCRLQAGAFTETIKMVLLR